MAGEVFSDRLLAIATGSSVVRPLELNESEVLLVSFESS